MLLKREQGSGALTTFLFSSLNVYYRPKCALLLKTQPYCVTKICVLRDFLIIIYNTHPTIVHGPCLVAKAIECSTILRNGVKCKKGERE